MGEEYLERRPWTLDTELDERNFRKGKSQRVKWPLEGCKAFLWVGLQILGSQLVKARMFTVWRKEQLKQGKTLRIQQTVQCSFNQKAHWQEGWTFFLDFID